LQPFWTENDEKTFAALKCNLTFWKCVNFDFDAEKFIKSVDKTAEENLVNNRDIISKVC